MILFGSQRVRGAAGSLAASSSVRQPLGAAGAGGFPGLSLLLSHRASRLRGLQNCPFYLHP